MNAQIRGGVRNMRMLMAVAPFAAISNSSVHTLLLITRAVSSFIKLYLLLLFMRVLLSWFPAFNWEDQPWLALRQVCFASLAACCCVKSACASDVDAGEQLVYRQAQWFMCQHITALTLSALAVKLAYAVVAHGGHMLTL